MEIGFTKLYKIENFPHVGALLKGQTELTVYFLLSNDKWDDRKGDGFYMYGELDEEQLIYLDEGELHRVHDYLEKKYVQSYYIGKYEITLKKDTDGENIIFEDPKYKSSDRYYRYEADELMADLETKDFATGYTISPELHARLPNLEFIERYKDSFDEIRKAGILFFKKNAVNPNILTASPETFAKIEEEGEYEYDDEVEETESDTETKEHEFTVFDVIHNQDETLPEGVFSLEYDADIRIVEDED